jgi:hypothetical protein
MAVKRLPAGVNIDMGFGEESPMDKLSNLLNAAGAVAAGVQRVRENRNTEQLNSIQMLNNVIDKADDPQDLQAIKNRISELPYNYDNDSINIAKEALELKYEQASSDFSDIQALGDEIAGFMTSPISFKDAGGNDISKMFSEMSIDEIMAHAKQNAGTPGLRTSLFDDITTKMNKMDQLSTSLGMQFGQYKNGEFQKNPRFKFKNHLGADINMPEFLSRMETYGNQMEMFIDAGLGPSGILNYEEAQLIKRGDLAEYNNIKKQREKEFTNFIGTADRNIQSLSDEIIELRTIDSDDIGAIISQPGFEAKYKNILQTTDAQGNPVALSLFQQQEGVNQFTNTASMYDDALSDLSRMSKDQVVSYLTELNNTLKGERELNVQAATAWGFGGYFGRTGAQVSEAQLQNLIDANANTGDDGSQIDTSGNFIQSFPFNEANKDSLPVRNNNPGNLKSAGQPGSVEGEGGFAKFDNIQDGWQALYNQIKLDAERGDTIESFIKGHVELDYTDAYSKTDQDEYVKFLQQELKVSKNTLLKDVDRTKLVEAVSKMEGYLDPRTGMAPTESQIQSTYEESVEPILLRTEEINESFENNIENNIDKDKKQVNDNQKSVKELKVNIFVGAKDTGKSITLSKPDSINSIKSLYRDDMKKMRYQLKVAEKRKVTSNYDINKKNEVVNRLKNKIKNTDFQTWWDELSPSEQKKLGLKFGNKEQRDFIRYHAGRMPYATQTLQQLPGTQEYGTPSKTFYDELRPGSALDTNK